jgi:hypothetical protein
MEMNSRARNRKLSSDRKRRTIRKARARRRFDIENLEERLVLAGQLLYEAITEAPLTLQLSGGTVEVVNTITSGVLASKALADITTGVRIEAAGFNIDLTIDDSVPLVAGGVSFIGGAGTSTLIGPDAAASWSLSGAGSGTMSSGGNVVTFSGVENLRGGTDADTFNISSTGFVEVTIDGGDGDDTLVGAPVSNTWTLNAADGGTLTWSVTAGPVVTEFAQDFLQIENLTGGNAADSFLLIAGGSSSGQINGGGGIDTLTGGDEVNTWTLTGPNSGTLNTADFVAIENFTGGQADDTFSIVGAGASLSGLLDGGEIDPEAPATDSLDYSLRGAAVSLNLQDRTGPGAYGSVRTHQPGRGKQSRR